MVTLHEALYSATYPNNVTLCYSDARMFTDTFLRLDTGNSVWQCGEARLDFQLLNEWIVAQVAQGKRTIFINQLPFVSYSGEWVYNIAGFFSLLKGLAVGCQCSFIIRIDHRDKAEIEKSIKQCGYCHSLMLVNNAFEIKCHDMQKSNVRYLGDFDIESQEVRQHNATIRISSCVLSQKHAVNYQPETMEVEDLGIVTKQELPLPTVSNR